MVFGYSLEVKDGDTSLVFALKQRHGVNLTYCRTGAGITIFHIQITGKVLYPALVSFNLGDQVLILSHLFLIQYLFISRGKWGILQSF